MTKRISLRIYSHDCGLPICCNRSSRCNPHACEPFFKERDAGFSPHAPLGLMSGLSACIHMKKRITPFCGTPSRTFGTARASGCPFCSAPSFMWTLFPHDRELRYAGSVLTTATSREKHCPLTMQGTQLPVVWILLRGTRRETGTTICGGDRSSTC